MLRNKIVEEKHNTKRLKMALETPIDIFDTPELRYGKLRREFDKKYLNPKAWNHECDTKEIVQAYHDLLEFLERTESFRDLTEGLRMDIPVDNVHLVLDDLPFTPKQHDDLLEYVVAGKPQKPSLYSHEDKLSRIKEFFKREKENGLFKLEMKDGIEIMDYRRALRTGEVVYEDIENVFEDDAEKYALAKYDERNRRENEILEMRQKVYSKINKGLNAFSILKVFKKKVKKFLENYRTDLSYHDEEYWRTKIIITERAVESRRHKRERKVEEHSGIDETLASIVKNMYDETKEELENLKKIVDAKEENVAEKVPKVITEKAVGNRKQKKKVKATKYPKKDEILDPTVKEMFDEIKDELKNTKKIVDAKDGNIVEKESRGVKVIVEKVNDLKVDKTEFDEIKEELESLKKFNKKLVDAKNEDIVDRIEFDEIKEELESLKKVGDAKDDSVAEKVSKVIQVKVDEVLNDLKMDKVVFDKLKDELESLKTSNKKLVDEVNDLKVEKTVFDKIKEELESLKTFNKKLFEVAVEKETELTAMKVKGVNDVKKSDKKVEEVLDVDDPIKKLVWSNDKNAEGYENKVIGDEDEDGANETVSHEVEVGMVNQVTKLKFEGERGNNEKADEDVPSVKEILDAARVQENIVENLPEPPDTEDDEIKVKLKRLKKFNKRLRDDKNKVVVVKEIKPEANKNVDDKRSKKLYDKIVPECGPIDIKDDFMYMQVPSGSAEKDEVDTGMNASMLMPLIHAIIAMLLISGKTLHEHRLLVARLSKYSRSSWYSGPQQEITLSSSSPCSCQRSYQTHSGVCCEMMTAFAVKVSGMADKTRTGVAWMKQLFGAVSCAKEKIVRTVNLIGRVRLQLQWRIIE